MMETCSSPTASRMERRLQVHPALTAGIAQVVEDCVLEEREIRQTQQNKVPKVELEEKHTETCRLLPNRLAMLDRLPRHAVVAEVGVAFGDFSQEIMKRADPAALHLIDAWSTERYRAGLEKIRQSFSNEIETERVVINQGLSTDVLETYPDDFFDWVYIDTDHTYQTTIQELRTAQRIVRPSGHIAGHDHCTGNVVKPFPYGVVQAVTQFCKEEGWTYAFLTAESHGHASFCLRKL